MFSLLRGFLLNVLKVYLIVPTYISYGFERTGKEAFKTKETKNENSLT